MVRQVLKRLNCIFPPLSHCILADFINLIGWRVYLAYHKGVGVTDYLSELARLRTRRTKKIELFFRRPRGRPPFAGPEWWGKWRLPDRCNIGTGRQGIRRRDGPGTTVGSGSDNDCA